MGDAAIVFDPLSSHGIAKGIDHGSRPQTPFWRVSTGMKWRWSGFRIDSLLSSPSTSRYASATTRSSAGGQRHRSGVGGSLAEDE